VKHVRTMNAVYARPDFFLLVVMVVSARITTSAKRIHMTVMQMPSVLILMVAISVFANRHLKEMEKLAL